MGIIILIHTHSEHCCEDEEFSAMSTVIIETATDTKAAFSVYPVCPAGIAFPLSVQSQKWSPSGVEAYSMGLLLLNVLF